MQIARRIVVTGRVQGVSFRDWARATARPLGLSGWVRNRHDGSVEILAIGSETAVAALARACETGPSQARVDQVAVHPAEAEHIAGFERRPTA